MTLQGFPVQLPVTVKLRISGSVHLSASMGTEVCSLYDMDSQLVPVSCVGAHHRRHGDHGRQSAGLGHSLGHRFQDRWVSREELLFNQLELRAISLALQAFQNILRGHRVEVLSDSSNLCEPEKEHSKSSTSADFSQVSRWVERHLLALDVAYLPGEESSLVDSFSRMFCDPHEWTLNAMHLQEIFAHWETPEVDLMAMAAICLPVYIS